jgi:beta-phosphoglucomutase-like phosphatase (HAD superfamily)
MEGKPHPEPSTKAAASLGVSPEQCLVVEDTPAGIKAGKAAGCRVLALRSTMSDEVLSAAQPDWIADNCLSIELMGFHDGNLYLRITDAYSP